MIIKKLLVLVLALLVSTFVSQTAKAVIVVTNGQAATGSVVASTYLGQGNQSPYSAAIFAGSQTSSPSNFELGGLPDGRQIFFGLKNFERGLGTTVGLSYGVTGDSIGNPLNNHPPMAGTSSVFNAVTFTLRTFNGDSSAVITNFGFRIYNTLTDTAEGYSFGSLSASGANGVSIVSATFLLGTNDEFSTSGNPTFIGPGSLEIKLVSSVPEPSSWLVTLLGGSVLLMIIRKELKTKKH